MSDEVSMRGSSKTATYVALVLCADPDTSVRITHWLSTAGVDTFQVFDGSHAASVLAQHRVTAIITDRLLPPWPGLSAFPLLRQQYPKLSVIFVGNSGLDGLPAAAGATQSIEFPLRRQSVLDALAKQAAAA